MIKVKVERIWEGKEKKVRLVEFKGLGSRSLPREYMTIQHKDEKRGACVVVNEGHCLIKPAYEDFEKWVTAFGLVFGAWYKFVPNNCLTLQQWDLVRETISKAGNRLKRINDKIRKEWSGIKVYKW